MPAGPPPAMAHWTRTTPVYGTCNSRFGYGDWTAKTVLEVASRIASVRLDVVVLPITVETLSAEVLTTTVARRVVVTVLDS